MGFCRFDNSLVCENRPHDRCCVDASHVRRSILWPLVEGLLELTLRDSSTTFSDCYVSGFDLIAEIVSPLGRYRCSGASFYASPESVELGRWLLGVVSPVRGVCLRWQAACLRDQLPGVNPR